MMCYSNTPFSFFLYVFDHLVKVVVIVRIRANQSRVGFQFLLPYWRRESALKLKTIQWRHTGIPAVSSLPQPAVWRWCSEGPDGWTRPAAAKSKPCPPALWFPSAPRPSDSGCSGPCGTCRSFSERKNEPNTLFQCFDNQWKKNELWCWLRTFHCSEWNHWSLK